MSQFNNWRREVNIILNDTLGFSLKEMDKQVEEDVKRLYDNGEDPMDAAQYAASLVNPTLDLEQILLDKTVPKQRSATK